MTPQRIVTLRIAKRTADDIPTLPGRDLRADFLRIAFTVPQIPRCRRGEGSAGVATSQADHHRVSRISVLSQFHKVGYSKKLSIGCADARGMAAKFLMI